MAIRSLDPSDYRIRIARVAGPAALLIAKLHKLGERKATPGRLVDKDAHDLYRLLAATNTQDLAADLRTLTADDVAGPATSQALPLLVELFAAGPDALGARMAGRAEEGVGDPVVVSASVTALAQELLATLAETGN